MISQFSARSDDNRASLNLPNGRRIPAADYHPKAMRLMELTRIFDRPHLINHIPRYLHTIRHMPHGKHLRSGNYDSALEIGDDVFLSPRAKRHV
jgi:hypothetical protein